VVPWLDGIDAPPQPGRHDAQYRLLDDDGQWAVYAMNTSNWSHVTSTLPEPLESRWRDIPGLLASGDTALENSFRSQLDPLVQFDMARVSKHQLEALRSIIAATPLPKHRRLLRIVVMHHHLRSPGLREELKPFADVSNVEQVRAFLRDSSIDVVVHGHKHEPSVQFDHVYDSQGSRDRRILTISGATFEPTRQMDAVRLITLPPGIAAYTDCHGPGHRRTPRWFGSAFWFDYDSQALGDDCTSGDGRVILGRGACCG
jgi:hypothetical protein